MTRSREEMIQAAITEVSCGDGEPTNRSVIHGGALSCYDPDDDPDAEREFPMLIHRLRRLRDGRMRRRSA